MDDAKQQLVDKLKGSNNVLVTVGRNPSVDQLSALLGLTLFLNKQGKHAAAVFSGEVPSTLEFLQPEATIEKNTDSLRDFIIALDKSKADKLRYKVEDDVVRIFITPYKTSISQDDFEFSQGDFNVDVVVAIGVSQQEDLDEAIIAHGRILHDATVTSINTAGEGGIGIINWHKPDASSLSEIITDLVQTLAKGLLDEQIATALLTGIVAETDRFSNEKTTAETMSASAALMAAGANQQLVASKLQEPDGGYGGVDEGGTAAPAVNDDGTLEIDHQADEESDGDAPGFELPEPTDEENADEAPETEDENPPANDEADSQDSNAGLTGGSRLITEAPTMGGTLTANTEEEGLDPSINPLSDQPKDEQPQLLSRKTTIDPASGQAQITDNAQDQPAATSEPPAPAPMPEPAPPVAEFTPPPPAWTPPPPQPPAPVAAEPDTEDKGPYSTLADLEESIGNSHTDEQAPATDTSGAPSAAPAPLDTSGLDAARDEVTKALSEAAASGNAAPEPIQALGAQPLGEDLRPTDGQVSGPPSSPQVTDSTAPPPVPPPFQMPPLGNQPPQQ